jgi:hypothetical protein
MKHVKKYEEVVNEGVDTQMSLEQFKAQVSLDLDKFVEDWEAGATDNPSNYPVKMAEGDWYDQFMTFLGSL